MTDVLPYLVILALPALGWAFLEHRWRDSRGVRRLPIVAVAVVVAWGGIVNASGALFRSGYCWSASPILVDKRPSRVWDWADPQFMRPVRDLADGRSLRAVTIGSCPRPEES
jgi:hypothetical protein